MADKTNDKANTGQEGDAQSGGKKPIKIILGVVIVLGLEIGTIFATAMLTNKPKVMAADPFKLDQSDESERIIEVPVIKGRFPNRKSGRSMLYQTEITVQVKKKNEDKVKQLIEENQARIKMSVGTIWRNAEPRHFNEPYLSTLTRQVRETLEKIIDANLPEGEDSRVEGVLIPTLTGFPSDG